jgi:hypothetical protein
MKTVLSYKRPLAMITIIVAGFAMGNGFVSLLLFGLNQPMGAVLSTEPTKGQTGYTTVYRDPNGPGPDGKRFVGRRNYKIVSGKIIDQSKGFEI